MLHSNTKEKRSPFSYNGNNRHIFSVLFKVWFDRCLLHLYFWTTFAHSLTWQRSRPNQLNQKATGLTFGLLKQFYLWSKKLAQFKTIQFWIYLGFKCPDWLRITTDLELGPPQPKLRSEIKHNQNQIFMQHTLILITCSEQEDWAAWRLWQSWETSWYFLIKIPIKHVHMVLSLGIQ